VLTKCLGTNRHHNVIRATLDAFSQLRLRDEREQELRGAEAR
jgi:ribosomal protein S5